MADRIHISEIQLYNYTTVEYMAIARKLLETEGFHLMKEVDAQALVQASEQQAVHDLLKNADELIIADAGILSAAGLSSEELGQEIARMDFCMDFMRHLEKMQKRVVVVGLAEEDTVEVRELLHFEFPKLNVVEFPVARMTDSSADTVVNEINSAGADVLLSVLPFAEEMKFLIHHKGRISARIWYGIGQGRFEYSRPGLADQVKRGILQRRLKSRIDVKTDPV